MSEKEKDIKVVNRYKIYEILDFIRSRPSLLLTSKSITALENYVQGYLVYGNKRYSSQIYNEGDPDFNEFKWWLIGKPKINMSSGPQFHELLLKECKNDEGKAFDLFFKKLDEFKELKKV